MSPGRGKALESWVASELAEGVTAGLLLAARKLEPEMRAYRGRLIPKGKAPPDFLVVTADQTATYLEAKETDRPRWPLSAIEEHQAIDLGALPGSLVVVSFTSGAEPYRVAIPWSAISGRWWALHEAEGPAKPGTASLTQEQAEGLGRRVDGGGLALAWAVVDSISGRWA